MFALVSVCIFDIQISQKLDSGGCRLGHAGGAAPAAAHMTMALKLPEPSALFHSSVVRLKRGNAFMLYGTTW